MITGMSLGQGDQPEHLPYARAGFAVVAYELDGEFDTNSDDQTELVNAMIAFRSAEAGVANAREAIDYVVAHRPEIDPDRLYTAGHSSAANVSLLVALNELRIKGCIAYAPACDVESRLGHTGIDQLNGMLSGFRQFIHDTSPINRASELRCPLFLFHAVDDSNCPIEDSERFIAIAKRSNADVTFVRAPSGDHYDSMIQQGVPRAIEWLKSKSQHNGSMTP